MEPSREDLFIAAALTGLLSGAAYGRSSVHQLSYLAIDIGRNIAKASEPYQSLSEKEKNHGQR